MDRIVFYRTIWRWHFYAGLFVMPFILLLSVSGIVYLFKPQIDHWEERAFFAYQTSGPAVSANAQLDAALARFPDMRFDAYRLPQKPGDPAMVRLKSEDGKRRLEVFVASDGKVLGSINPYNRIIAFTRRLHGQLLLGPKGSWIVEMTACWAIVMILTGLALWWPRGAGPAGTIWPRLNRGRRVLWRDVHAVTGIWVSGLALLFLISGLPWAAVWGSGFDAVRSQMGWVNGERDWTIGGEHAGHAAMGHDHAEMMRRQQAGIAMASLTDIAAKARTENLPYPTMIVAPGEAMVWTVKSETQNRPLRRTMTFDTVTGDKINDSGFADQHPIDRAVGYGIAWHEGSLFGTFNVVIDLLTAVALCALAITGFIQWRRRAPDGGIGAPPAARGERRLGWLVLVMAFLAALLPLFALSLALLWLFDRVAVPRLPGLARWLGVAPA